LRPNIGHCGCGNWFLSAAIGIESCQGYDRGMKKPFTWEHGPFEDCWKCKREGTFGILSIGGNRVTKRCTKCRYTHSEELPQLDKKVIYLDQFAFSELHKLRAGTRREDKWSKFWSEVDGILNEAVLLQQVLLPHSNIHHKETIVSPFAGALRKTQEAVGGDITLLDTDAVQLGQIEEYVRAYFEDDEPKVVFDVDDVLNGQRNNWLPTMRISVEMDWSRSAQKTREGRDNTHADVASLIASWEKSGYGFDEVIEHELSAYFDSRQQALMQARETLDKGLTENDNWAMMSATQSLVVCEMEIIRYHAKKVGVAEEMLARATSIFWKWPKNREQPFGRILAYLFAALAAQFKGGRRKLPTPGFLNDITAISAYLPYVDAMFIDNECAELLKHGRCRNDLNYNAAIFSLNKADAFFRYVREIVECTPNDVRVTATAIYGRDRR